MELGIAHAVKGYMERRYRVKISGGLFNMCCVYADRLLQRPPVSNAKASSVLLDPAFQQLLATDAQMVARAATRPGSKPVV